MVFYFNFTNCCFYQKKKITNKMERTPAKGARFGAQQAGAWGRALFQTWNGNPTLA
jgi:hypothetical protein